MRRRIIRAAGVIVASALIAASVPGCNLIAKTDDFKVGTPSVPDACATATSSCAAGTCLQSFDNAHRISGFSNDGSLPPLPEAGTADAAEAGDDGSEGEDGGTDDGAAEEAGGADGGASEAGTVEGGAHDGGREGGGGGGAHNGSGGGGGGAGDAGAPSGGTSPEGGAAAGPPCSSLPDPVIIVGSGGLSSIAAQLGALTSMVPITVVFVSAHACDGANAVILNQNTLTLGATTGTYWDVSGTAHTCQLDPGGNYADIGLSGLFPEVCLSLPQGTSGVGDFLGPVVPEAMVVPIGSTQTSISAEALYYTVGLGPAAVAPWTDANFVFQNPTATSQLDFGIAIGVPSTAWQGRLTSGSNQTVTAVVTSSAPEKTLAAMSTDLVESISRSSTIKELAFQDLGQHCAYYPNLTATSADKTNIRTGRYRVWGFTHMFAKVNAANVPLNPNAGKIVLFFTGDAPTPTGNFLQFVINDRLVPPCAMSVTRSSEMGALSPYKPHPSCNCYFDSVATGSTTCQACKTAADCPSTAPNCNLGFCEAQ